MFIALTKILEHEGSISPCRFYGFYGSWLLVTRVCSIYLDEFFFLFAGWNFIFLFLVLIRWNEEGKWAHDFFLLHQGFESFPSDLTRERSRNLVCVCVCVVFVKIKLMVVGFCSIKDWSCSGWCVWDLRTLAQLQGS